MALKQYNPTSAGRRGLVLVDRSALWKGRPVKELTEGLQKSGGRNNHGHITARHRGGGHKRRYRMIDFKRRKAGVMATVERLEYDPNRTAFIALLRYDDGEQAYILAPQRLGVGDKVEAGDEADIKPGNALPLRRIPVGTIVHNVELKPGKAARWPVPPAPMSSWSGATPAKRCCACHRARCAWSARSAGRRSAPSRTRTTPTRPSPRLAATAGAAGARTSAASS